MRMVAITALLVVSAGLMAAVATSRTETPVRSLGCAQSLNLMNAIGGAHPPEQRLVLGRVWLPKASVVLGRNAWRRMPTGEDAFIKYGVEVTPGPPVTLQIARGYEQIYALEFKDPLTSELRFTPCPVGEGPWTAWTGGYSVSRPVCAALIVRAGARTERVSLALGRACSSSG